MTALDIAYLLAQLTRLVAMAWLSAGVPAVREVTSALLLTRRVPLADDPEVFVRTTFEALAGTKVTAGL